MDITQLRLLKKTAATAWEIARTNFLLRIEGSYLGILWYLLNPLAMFLIIIFVKNQALNMRSGHNYGIYLMTGIVCFVFFKTSLSKAFDSISSNINYLKSINNIAPETLVLSGVAESVMSHVFDMLLIVVFLLFYRMTPAGLIFYPFIFANFLVFIVGASFIFATLGIMIKDAGKIWQIAVQIIFFVTPIFYVLPEKGPLHYLNMLNPLFYYAAFSRETIIDMRAPEPAQLAAAAALSIASLAAGTLFFNRHKRSFAEM
jgi:ABC-type polysaccharide/polyol phosphate export systems, permease component